MTTAAIVLAAGGGTRFTGASHKLLAEVRGRSVVAHAVDAAADAGLDEVIVVVGAIDLSAVLPPGITIVENPRWMDGQATSIGVGLAAAAGRDHDAVVIGLGDQPFVGSAPWRSVAASDQTPIAVANYGGRRRNPVRLHSSVWDLVPREGDEGARALMRSRPELVGDVPCQGTPADIDTTEDLEQWS